MVPGAGPSPVGGQRKHATAAGGRPSGRSSGGYLVDAITLRRTFREHYIKGLRQLLARAELKLEGEFEYLQQTEAQGRLLSELERVEWVSYIEPPPHENCRPEHVLKYLARYLTGGPISESRIVSADDRQVTFLAREGKVIGGERQQVPVTLSAVEFTRRWTQHILPKGYTKTRRYGGRSNRRADEYVQRCAMLLDGAHAHLSADAIQFDPALLDLENAEQTESDHGQCPHCGATMRQVSEALKPSWCDIMNSHYRPSWYTRSRREI